MSRYTHMQYSSDVTTNAPHARNLERLMNWRLRKILARLKCKSIACARLGCVQYAMIMIIACLVGVFVDTILVFALQRRR